MDEIGRSENLFEHFGARRVLESMPLASRMRPVRLEDFVGQTNSKENLSISIQAAKMREEALDKFHIVFHCLWLMTDGF